MNRSRWKAIGSIAGGVLAGLAVFLFTNTLITGSAGQQGAADAGQIVDVVRIKEDLEVITKPPLSRPEKPPPPERLPPLPRPQEQDPQEPQNRRIRIDVPGIDVRGAAGHGPYLGPGGPQGAGKDSDAVPVVRINPDYPRDALMEGIEGYVKFDLLVATDGTVLSVRVTDAAPGRIFVRNAKRAVRRWKFKPRVVDGVAVERWVRTSIVFELED